jgi:cation-transporting P-type ATPase A/B/Cu+-exporting ATPase
VTDVLPATSGERSTSQRPTGHPVKVTLLIGGMTCGACATRIERKLNSLEGVEAQVNLASERATISAPAEMTIDQLVGQVETIGFTASRPEEVAEADQQDAAIDRRVRTLGIRLAVTALLFMPLCDCSIAFWLVPSIRFPHWQLLLLVLAAPVVTWAAWPFYQAAVRNARHHTTTMDTLVSLGIVSATAWSVYAMFWRDTGHAAQSAFFVIAHRSGGAIYLDVAAGVTLFLLAGRYFEATSKRRTGNALRSLAAIGAKEAAVIGVDGVERRVPSALLQVGDRFVVRPGETIATDGTVVSGCSTVDRSVITGESTPLDVEVGDPVVGGTVSVGGFLEIEATEVGADTQLAQMIRLVEEAQNQKAGIQRLADRIAAIFVPAVIVSALLTLIGWLVFGGSSEQAWNAALSVLIIACPCALGLATPAALHVASGQGALLGIFFKGYQSFEVSNQIDTVLLDKTGTVTLGRMDVVDMVGVAGIDQRTLLKLAGSLEQGSEHLVGRAIASRARRDIGELAPVAEFVALSGLGARGIVDGHQVSIGRPELFADIAPVPAELKDCCAGWERTGRTTVLISRDHTMIGAMALADTVHPTAGAAVRQLSVLGLRTILITGDNEPTARAVGASIGVDDVIAGALPADKVAAIKRLQQEGHSVAMVGDGVNDGPALASADLGLAVGSGTDVAINAADLIVLRDDLRVVPTAIMLARRTIKTIRSNLVWAFAYNVAAIPLAACGLLNPLIAAAAMALSSGFVVWNSSRIRMFDQHLGTTMSDSNRVGPSVAGPSQPVAHTDRSRHSSRTAEPTRVSA